MKNLVLLLGSFLLSSSVGATTLEKNTVIKDVFRYNNSVIFVENGITFSIYPDGEFDFYIDNRVNFGANINFRRSNITFNSGFDYSPFVQYDDYGAVIQIENVPIFYDFYGRVSQIGGIDIWYNNGRLRRVGGLNVYYNNRGFFNRFNGYINVYNRHYIYSPFHSYFARPALGFCLVYDRPYRRFYNPIRYTFYRPYMNNARRFYTRVGHTYRYSHRPERERLYRNDSRVVARDNRGRRDHGYARNDRDFRDSKKEVRSNRTTPYGRTTSRTESARSGKYTDKGRMNDRSNTRSTGISRNTDKARVNGRSDNRSTGISRNADKARVNGRSDNRSAGVARNSSPAKENRSVSRSSISKSQGRTVSRPMASRSETRSSSSSNSVKRSNSMVERSKDHNRGQVARKTANVRSGKEIKGRSTSRTSTTRSRRVQ